MVKVDFYLRLRVTFLMQDSMKLKRPPGTDFMRDTCTRARY